MLSVTVRGVIRQRLAERGHNAHIVNYQTVAFPFRYPVCAGDCLHKSMCFHGLVQVQARKTLHVETRQPHRAYEHNAERVLRVFVLLLQIAFRHFRTVRENVKPPLFERPYLVLLLTDHNRHFRFFHPLQFARKLLRLLLRRAFELSSDALRLLAPVALRQIVHPHTGDFVQTDEHRLSGRPEVGVMPHEITRNRF